MKKILSLLVLLVAFASCEEDVKFNTPAVQAFRGNTDGTSDIWKAREFSAVKSGNSVIVTAKNDVETIVLRINNPVPGETEGSIHPLGVDELNKATYALSVDGIDQFYQTGTNIGDGQIQIRRTLDNNINATDGKGYISGTFYFNAKNDAGETVNYHSGVFYKVPIVAIQ
ncbi:DUF6252 family protein [Flavobacterium sp. DG1-102-2]|uniref:DUF6252 family protein n=1 Tax=Flavobacterium sp. DG1-102-2 TaxID=3081663 RepID=UPI002949A46D|nr:DUF6252 family protein [Flavobacterium sp. DG1-102-2]MDV6169381.1 DUF6252 family protein [Flavobacterium sp. DG1-102-2]